MCLDVVSAHIALESGTVRQLEVAAILRGPFDDCSPYTVHVANLVQPTYSANGSYESLARYPLTVVFAPGEDVWHAGEATHLVDAGTDGATLAPLCGQTVFAEVALGAVSTSENHGEPTTITSWREDVDFVCR